MRKILPSSAARTNAALAWISGAPDVVAECSNDLRLVPAARFREWATRMKEAPFDGRTRFAMRPAIVGERFPRPIGTSLGNEASRLSV